jgi:hypothetical protein
MVRYNVVIDGNLRDNFLQKNFVFELLFEIVIFSKNHGCKGGKFFSFESENWESEILEIFEGNDGGIDWLLFFDETEGGERAIIFVFMELPLEGFLISKVEFVEILSFFEKIVFDEIDTILGFIFFRNEGLRRLGVEALCPGYVDAGLLDRHE